MIYLDSPSSIIESIYLEEPLNNKVPNCKIFVNPENIRYLIGKVIVINSSEYDQEKNIPILLDNNCKVISRVSVLDKFKDKVDFQPYIIRICNGVKWNGITVQRNIGGLGELFDDGECNFDINKGVLYFPKIDKKYSSPKVMDREGNLTEFGWALHQVGVNIDKETEIKNLDIMKSGKILFE